MPTKDMLLQRRQLREVLQDADDADRPDAIVLVGSWARDGSVATPLSDVDLLIVGPGRLPSHSANVQLLRATAADVRTRTLAGDDFFQWALRYGVPLKGRRLWSDLRDELLPLAPWPDPETNILRALKRLRAAESLLEMGDQDAGQEEARFAASHVARARLLRGRVFPLSRPELAPQLRELGEFELADLMDRLSSPEGLAPSQLTAILGGLRGLLRTR